MSVDKGLIRAFLASSRQPAAAGKKRVKKAGKEHGCSSHKRPYYSEHQALKALVQVRRKRWMEGDETPESRAYKCDECDQYHLTSQPIVQHQDFRPSPARSENEPLEQYARRLERRIAEQRTQLMSLHAIGHGGTNKETRRRIQSLTVALAEVTELWQQEKRNREALVKRLNKRRWWRP